MIARRNFLQMIPAAGAAFAGAQALAQAPAPALLVSEKDPQAIALGYVTDAKRADKKKFPKYAPPEHCALCQFYQGTKTAATAPCTIFGGKRVDNPGWCSAYVAKPA